MSVAEMLLSVAAIGLASVCIWLVVQIRDLRELRDIYWNLDDCLIECEDDVSTLRLTVHGLMMQMIEEAELDNSTIEDAEFEEVIEGPDGEFVEGVYYAFEPVPPEELEKARQWLREQDAMSSIDTPTIVSHP